MNPTIEFIVKYGYWTVFFGVLAEQLGVPLPAILFLLAGGALAGSGELNLALVLIVAVAAATIADAVWFEIGRRRGGEVLGFLCRISLEPDSCVRRTETTFSKYGANSLLFAKFLPGFSTVAPPLAAITKMPLPKFLLFNAVGATLWAGTFIGLGYVFSDQFESVAEYAESLGSQFVVVLLAILLTYAGWKFAYRQWFLRSLRVARILPEELKRKLDAGENVLIVDLRDRLDFDLNPISICTALRFAPEELAERHQELPRDRDIVLYCTCPNEATSARLALRLRKRGIKRIRPLAGGLDGWIELDFPLAAADAPQRNAATVQN